MKSIAMITIIFFSEIVMVVFSSEFMNGMLNQFIVRAGIGMNSTTQDRYCLSNDEQQET